MLAKSDDGVCSSELTCCKERNDTDKLSSDLHVHVMAPKTHVSKVVYVDVPNCSQSSFFST